MQSKQIIVVLTLGFLPILCAQPPSGVNRTPTPKSAPPILQQYDFGGQLRTLEDPNVLPNTVTPALAAPAVPNGAAPKDFRPKTDVPLTPTALKRCG